MAAPFARLPVNIQLPQTAHPARRAAFARFLDLGWPTRKQEAWRYTDLAGLAGVAFAPASGPAAVPPTDLSVPPGFETWTACNLSAAETDPGTVGAPTASPSALDEPAPADPLAALHAAFTAPGLVVTGGAHIAHHVIGGTSTPVLAAVHHRVELPAGASATLVLATESASGPDATDTAQASTLALTRVSVTLGPDARLTLVRAPRLAADDSEWCRIDATLGPRARLDATGLDTTGRLARTEFVTTVAGEGATFHRSGLMSARGRSHFDSQYATTHAVGPTVSRGLFRNLADEHARVVLNDRVEVGIGADGTDSEQHVASWLLSARAEIDAKPELVIEADEVKAAHGNSFGRSDPDQLFYLRARGLSAETAGRLLRDAFIAEALELLPGSRADLDTDGGTPAALEGTAGLGLRDWLLARAGLA